jgi:hypothetical protein
MRFPKSYQLTTEQVEARAKQLAIPTQIRLEFADPNSQGPQYRNVSEAELREKIYQAENVFAQRRTFIVTIVVAILSSTIACIAAYNSYQAAEASRRSAQASIVWQITESFFYKEPHKTIIRRIEEQQPIRVQQKNKIPISDEDIDDHLGLLDTVGTYVRHKVIDLPLVDAVFGHYVKVTFENPDIQDYLRKIRSQESNLFDDFICLYYQLEGQGNADSNKSKQDKIPPPSFCRPNAAKSVPQLN